MDTLIALLISYGYIGMFISAFVAGSVLPFSSELVLAGLIPTHLNTNLLILAATLGNVVGGMFNYWIGSFGRIDWIERYLHVKKEKLERTQAFMEGKGAWMGFFAFLPIIGSAITVVLGYTRANIPISIASMTIGKLLRYALLAYGVSFIF